MTRTKEQQTTQNLTSENQLPDGETLNPHLGLLTIVRGMILNAIYERIRHDMARQAISSPLTEKHYQDLKRIQKSAHATLDYLKKCDNCKLDVAQEIEATQEQLSIIEKLIKEFFPNQPL